MKHNILFAIVSFGLAALNALLLPLGIKERDVPGTILGVTAAAAGVFAGCVFLGII